VTDRDIRERQPHRRRRLRAYHPDRVPAARQAESWLFRLTEAGCVLIAARDALRGAEYPRGVWFAIVPAGQPGP
jgi:hypothetical protein